MHTVYVHVRLTIANTAIFALRKCSNVDVGSCRCTADPVLLPVYHSKTSAAARGGGSGGRVEKG